MSVMPNFRRRQPLLVLATVGGLILATGCGGSSGDGANTDPSSTGSKPASSSSFPTMEELKRGTEQEPPTTGPAAKTGLSVAYISCGQVAPGCSGPGAGLDGAAEELGWTTNTFDGQFNVGGGYATAIQQAIASKPDAIAMAGIDCSQVKQSLTAAREAGIPVFSMLGSDCDVDGGEQLFAAETIYRKDISTTEQWYAAWGQQKVQYLIAKLGGDVRLINVAFNDTLPSINDGVESEIAKCSQCEIVDTVEVGTADAASPQGPIVPGVKAALLKHPDANALLIPFDTQLLQTGLLQALKNSPSGKSLVVAGGDGTPLGLTALKDGPLPTALTAYSSEWMGWALADSLNRYLNDAPQEPQGFGSRVVEQEDAPPGDAYEPAVDFKAAYRQAWGLTN